MQGWYQAGLPPRLNFRWMRTCRQNSNTTRGSGEVSGKVRSMPCSSCLSARGEFVESYYKPRDELDRAGVRCNDLAGCHTVGCTRVPYAGRVFQWCSVPGERWVDHGIASIAHARSPPASSCCLSPDGHLVAAVSRSSDRAPTPGSRRRSVRGWEEGAGRVSPDDHADHRAADPPGPGATAIWRRSRR